MTERNSFCQYLHWDSDFFGYRIARITLNHLTEDVIEQVIRWCNSHAIDCLYFLGDPDDAVTVRLAEDNRFRLLDIRVTFEKQIDNILVTREIDIECLIRHCTPDDIQSLRAIAKVSHRDSRFYYDSNFPVTLCDALYETWIEKSCHGYADAVLVAELQGQPVGYISCSLLGRQEGNIGLFAVGVASRGQGVSKQLVNESLRWFAEQGVTQVTVVTQGRNFKAQRLYQRFGFLTRSVQLWYHWWVSPKNDRVVE
jgi:dTDP-4-amino-4,6-dideoxy-D-galactose acyltransferase